MGGGGEAVGLEGGAGGGLSVGGGWGGLVDFLGVEEAGGGREQSQGQGQDRRGREGGER